MEYISCGRGHFYDPNLYASCPRCAEEAGKGTSTQLDFTMENYSATQPVYGATGGMDTVPPTMPSTTPPTTPGPQFGGPQFDTPTFGGSGVQPYEPTTPSPRFNAAGVQSYDPTTPVSPVKTYGGADNAALNPVVGWLICVSGPNKGADYRIHNGYNYIGRADNMDICIQGDSYISSERAAMISYDDEERSFFFGPGGGHNAVRVNGRMVHAPQELHAYDELKIGMSLFRFVPFCGPQFDWKEG